MLLVPKGRQPIARGVSPWEQANEPESREAAAGDCRPYGAPIGNRLFQGLTPLAIGCRRSVAQLPCLQIFAPRSLELILEPMNA